MFSLPRPLPGPSRSSSIAGPGKLALDLSMLFGSGKFADCTIACQGREFRCHKNILSAR